MIKDSLNVGTDCRSETFILIGQHKVGLLPYLLYKKIIKKEKTTVQSHTM